MNNAARCKKTPTNYYWNGAAATVDPDFDDFSLPPLPLATEPTDQVIVERMHAPNRDPTRVRNLRKNLTPR